MCDQGWLIHETSWSLDNWTSSRQLPRLELTSTIPLILSNNEWGMSWADNDNETDNGFKMTGLYNSISSHSQCPVVSQHSSHNMPVVLGAPPQSVITPDNPCCSQSQCLCLGPGGVCPGGPALRPGGGGRHSGPSPGARWGKLLEKLSVAWSVLLLINFLFDQFRIRDLMISIAPLQKIIIFYYLNF